MSRKGAENDDTGPLGCRPQPSGKEKQIPVQTRWALDELLGSGAEANVYKARDLRLGRVCVVKVLHEKWAATGQVAKRFLRAAKTHARNTHLNVVRVDDFGHCPHHGPYVVLEFIDGRTLSELIAECDRSDELLGLGAVVRISADLADGVRAIHTAGTVHRDIKPANILIPRGGCRAAVLIDGGLVKHAEDEDLTALGNSPGTPKYMSREVRSGQEATTASDIYSLGLVFWFAAAGHHPADGRFAVPGATVWDVRVGDVPKKWHRALRDFSALVAEMLQLDPGARPSAAEVVARLRDVRARLR